jgi:hypothetical protein
LLAAAAFQPQTATATLAGKVVDAESLEPVEGVVVFLADIERSRLTDRDGRFVFHGVPAGPQHLSVRRIGYSPRTLHALVPGRGELLIDILLERRPTVLRPVEVRPAAAIQGAAEHDTVPFAGRYISIAAVRNNPVLPEPDVLLGLAGAEITARPETPSGLYVRGGASDHTAFLLDGIPVFSPYHAAGTFSAWNPDALESVLVGSASQIAPHADALSAVVEGRTLTPGTIIRVQGAASTTHARLAADGPLGSRGAGYLLSLRWGFPGYLNPPHETSYLRGRSGDALAKLESPVLGGRLRLVAYGSGNDFRAAALANSEGTANQGVSNFFEWSSRSYGFDWIRRTGAQSIRLAGWNASSAAGSAWQADSGSLKRLASRRSDIGATAEIERTEDRKTYAAGVWLKASRTKYRVVPVAGEEPYALGGSTPSAGLFVRHSRPLVHGFAASANLSVVNGAGAVRLAHDVRASWSWRERAVFTLGFDRSQQFAQSLRNPESVVGIVFPPELHVGAGIAGIPAARADQAMVTGTWNPAPGARVAAQAYVRHLRGLVLVAPRTADAFATNAFDIGTGNVQGLAVDASVTRSRYGVVAGYAWQRVRFRQQQSSHAPSHAPLHSGQAGVIVFPANTFSFRIGATAAVGRRAAAVVGAWEWESCNLLDRGCEFSGSPASDLSRASGLPHYLSVDVGARKHWHPRIAGRDAVVTAYASLTNILGRGNVLAVSRDSEGEGPAVYTMRPMVPLVIGLEWRF